MNRPDRAPTSPLLEPLESRRLLSSTPRDLSSLAYTQELSTSDVQEIVAQAASQGRPGQVICVCDRDGHLLALYQVSYAGAAHIVANPTKRLRVTEAIDRAVTASFFESTGEAFTTRTARFIIQDHFPPGVQNTPGGPLLGVEFSSLPFSDVFPKTAGSISGDPGGVPLFKNGVPIGAIGVSGDGSDTAARADLITKGDQDFNGRAYNGREESDFDESVAMAGAQGFYAPTAIQATQIFIAGLRLPFTASKPATGRPARTFAELISTSAGQLVPFDNTAANPKGQRYDATIHAGSRAYPLVDFHGFAGELRDPIVAPTAATDGLPYGVGLTKSDITKVITRAAAEALSIRGGIREPVGLPARVHISVVDLAGNVVGTFRLNDGTNFSYDVAVQKARTALYFSSGHAAMSTRAIGFLAQRNFPPGQVNEGTGPLYHLQNDISLGGLTSPILRNGITIFPGGLPLYKNGRLVGAVGVSGDGVDQDDLIAYTGTAGLRPPVAIESDHLSADAIRRALPFAEAYTVLGLPAARILQLDQLNDDARFGSVQLPYVKFPRNPEL